MHWYRAHRAYTPARLIADRHYNRQSVGHSQFVPPGRCVVLYSPRGAVWVTSWPIAQYVKHQWAGAWINTLFRKEHEGLASALIVDAVAATRAVWPEPPPLGLVTFIDPLHVQPRKVHGRIALGLAYFEAGFVHVGYTKQGLWAFQLTPDRMPPATPALTLGDEQATRL